MYTLQALWTQARERLDVTTVIFSNRKYAILLGELANVGANPGRTALDMLDLGNPDLDWCALAGGMGVAAARAETMEEFNDLFAQSLRAPRPVPDRPRDLSGVGDEEIERLANRLAMLVSDGGEADNAGRAVGALARRLGLSGGQLKAIFMAGADSAVAQTVRVRRVQREAARLRERLAEAEAAMATLQRERDSLLREAEQLQGELTVRRHGRRLRLLSAVAVVLMLGGAAALVGYGREAAPGRRDGAAAVRRAGLSPRPGARPSGGAAPRPRRGRAGAGDGRRGHPARRASAALAQSDAMGRGRARRADRLCAEHRGRSVLSGIALRLAGPEY